MQYFDKISEILKIFIEDIDKSNKEHESLQTISDIYKELLEYANKPLETIYEERFIICLLLDTIFGNNVYSYNFITRINKIQNEGYNEESKEFNSLKRFFEWLKENNYQIELKKELLKNKIETQSKLKRIANKAIMCIKKGIPLSLPFKSDFNKLKSIFSYAEANGYISTNEHIMLLHSLGLYNRKVYTESKGDEKEKQHFIQLFEEIPNILYAGFQTIQEVEVPEESKSNLNNISLCMYNQINEQKDVLDIIKLYQSIGYNDLEFNYILTYVLNKLMDDLATLSLLIKDIDIYNNMEERKEIITNYYDMLDIFLLVLNYYEEYNKNFELKDKSEETIDVELPQEQKRLIYSSNIPVPNKCKFITDLLKNVPEEYYEKVASLLAEFKTGEISSKKIRKILDYENIMELKDDQVRIFFRHIQHNVYCILGISVKKDTHSTNIVKTVCSRNTPTINADMDLLKQLKYGEKVEEELGRIISTKARKGTR